MVESACLRKVVKENGVPLGKALEKIPNVHDQRHLHAAG